MELEEVKNMFKFDEIIGIEVKETDTRPGLKVFCYYNPPLCSPNTAFFQFMASLQGNCVLAGDLNCKNKFWGSTINDKRGTELLDVLNCNNLITFNDQSPTRCDPFSGKEETLDLMIGNREAATLYKEFWVGLDVGSDHYPVHMTLQFNQPSHASPIKTRKVEKTNWKKWEKSLTNNCFNTASTASEVEINAALFTERIQKAFEESCPLTTIRNKPKNQFTPEIQGKVKEKRKLRREKNKALQKKL